MSEQPVIVDLHGKPARAAVSDNCPRCNADKAKRVPSGGFGERRDVCRECGHKFDEWTLG